MGKNENDKQHEAILIKIKKREYILMKKKGAQNHIFNTTKAYHTTPTTKKNNTYILYTHKLHQ